MKQLFIISTLIFFPFFNYAQDTTEITPLTIAEYMEHGISNPVDYWHRFDYENAIKKLIELRKEDFHYLPSLSDKASSPLFYKIADSLSYPEPVDTSSALDTYYRFNMQNGVYFMNALLFLVCYIEVDTIHQSYSSEFAYIVKHTYFDMNVRFVNNMNDILNDMILRSGKDNERVIEQMQRNKTATFSAINIYHEILGLTKSVKMEDLEHISSKLYTERETFRFFLENMAEEQQIEFINGLQTVANEHFSEIVRKNILGLIEALKE